MRTSLLTALAALSLLAVRVGSAATPGPRPRIRYTLRLDPARPDAAEVSIELAGAATSIHLAMKAHPEYDARYWRYLDGFRVAETEDDVAAGVAREDSTLWRVTLPGGHGVVSYRVHIQPSAPAGLRRAWLPYARTDGAFINTADFFLYLPEFPGTPAAVHLDVPKAWHIATALSPARVATERLAPDAPTLLDSPILLGALREWSFVEAGTVYHVDYWPLPNAQPFDTVAFVDELHRLTRAALEVFGAAPASDYHFLIQDGAADALEHRASLAIGVPSERLARDPHALLPEIAHEFFHTWNLVAIRPAGYNRLSYRAPERTPELWFGEGVTLYYADVLVRRAGLADSTSTRLDHLAGLLERYYASPAILSVSPERSSLAFGDSRITNPDATGGYYLQGELLGHAFEARIREATAERRGLDDVMRALFARARAPGDSGVTSQGLELVVDSVCACRMDTVFASEIRGRGPIDPTPLLTRLGLQLTVDSVVATDSLGRPFPDRRLAVDFPSLPAALRLVVTDPRTVWASAGLRTGDELVAVNEASVKTFAELQAALARLHVGDRVAVDIRRGGQPMRIAVTLASYLRPRVRLLDAPPTSAEQRARRFAWLAGR